MKISKVLEILNEALEHRDLELWLKKQAIEDLKKENAELRERIKELTGEAQDYGK